MCRLTEAFGVIVCCGIELQEYKMNIPGRCVTCNKEGNVSLYHYHAPATNYENIAVLYCATHGVIQPNGFILHRIEA